MDRHTAENIAEWMMNVLRSFCLCNKVSTLGTDNAANMKAAPEKLNFRHLPCFAHTLNLVVKNAITENIGEVVAKVKS